MGGNEPVAQGCSRIQELGDLFVTVTGRSTVREPQLEELERFDEGTEAPLAAYVDATTRADGLADVIDDPGSS